MLESWVNAFNNLVTIYSKALEIILNNYYLTLLCVLIPILILGIIFIMTIIKG